ncbi:MAG: Holliday junction resolvase RuvX [Candidatus Bipolaricaulia bacterium]
MGLAQKLVHDGAIVLEANPVHNYARTMWGRVLAIDWGEVRLGLALSDETKTIAQGFGVYKRRCPADDVSYLRGLIDERAVKRVVVGLPVHMDEAHSEQTERAQAFIRELEGHLSVSIEAMDERLTTAEAESSLREANLSRGRRKAKRDQLAATLILQRYLDQQRQSTSH